MKPALPSCRAVITRSSGTSYSPSNSVALCVPTMPKTISIPSARNARASACPPVTNGMPGIVAHPLGAVTFAVAVEGPTNSLAVSERSRRTALVIGVRGDALYLRVAIDVLLAAVFGPEVNLEVVPGGFDHGELVNVSAKQLEGTFGERVAGRGGEGFAEPG